MTLRILVTGAGGFVGGHLLAHLASHGHEAIPSEAPGRAAAGMRELDVRDPDAIGAALRELQPDGCIHLAALAFVPRTWEDPASAFEVNVVGTMNLLASLRDHAPGCRALVVSTALVYGSADPGSRIAEDHPMAPGTIYAVTKMAADLGALAFGDHHGIPVMTVRPANHIGPGQSAEYVAPAFARQIARIARGVGPAVLQVGNLESRRSFLDVRDVVQAYRLILEHGVPGRAYNVGGPELHRVGEVLDILGELAGVRPTVERDPALYRPTDSAPDLATDRVREDTGWAAERSLQDTLGDVLEEAAASVSRA